METLKAPTEKAASQSLPPQLLLMRTSRAGEALRELSAYATVGSVSPSTLSPPLKSYDPENVSNVIKASPDDGSPNEKLVQIHHGESFEDVLKANGASPEAIQGILTAFGVKHGESPVNEGQKTPPSTRGAGGSRGEAENSTHLGVRGRSAQGDSRDTEAAPISLDLRLYRRSGRQRRRMKRARTAA